MLLSRIRPATCKFRDGSEITLNSNVSGRTAKLAISRALAASKNLPDPDQLDALHSEVTEPLEALQTALTDQIERLDGAANVLVGKETFATGPLIDTALLVKAQADALLIAEPDADTSELERVADTLKFAAKQLSEQLALVRSRAKKADSFLRRTVAGVILRDSTDPETAREILTRHNGPIDWPIRDDNPDPQATFREHQTAYFDRKRKQKQQAKATARAELEASAERLWA